MLRATQMQFLYPHYFHICCFILHIDTSQAWLLQLPAHILLHRALHFNLGVISTLPKIFLLKKQLQGFIKVKPAMDNRLPITPNILSKLASALPSITTSAFSNTLFHAMYVLAFSAFLRVAEITKTAGAKQHFLLAKHVLLQKDPLLGISLELTIPHFKHSNQSTTLHLQQNITNPLLCPFLTLQTLMDVRGHKSPEEPFFFFIYGWVSSVPSVFHGKFKVVPVFLRTRYR